LVAGVADARTSAGMSIPAKQLKQLATSGDSDINEAEQE
jgi:hypothetical protein